MTVCCRCNADGKCRSCVCVKAGRPCTNCLPARRGHCSNTLQRTTSPPPSQPLDHNPPAISSAPAPAVASPFTFAPSASGPARDAAPALLHPSASIQANDSSTTPATPINAQPLPSPLLMAAPTFMWGECDAKTFTHSLSIAYAEVVHWKKNLFAVPLGKPGKTFVQELSRLFRAYAEQSALESVALQAVTVMSILLLQKPARNSKLKDHATCLQRRLNTWTTGDINSLVLEGRCLQKRLPKVFPSQKQQENLARTFSNLMFMGKTSAALDLLSQKGRGGVLCASEPSNPLMTLLLPQFSNRSILVHNLPPQMP